VVEARAAAQELGSVLVEEFAPRMRYVARAVAGFAAAFAEAMKDRLLKGPPLP
jgi:hypothetical protein